MEEQTKSTEKSESFVIALIQMKSTKDKEANLNRAQELVETAVKLHKPKIVILPEFFTTPINSKNYKNYAENESDSPTLKLLQSLAKEHNVHIIGGSFPSYKNDDENKKQLSATDVSKHQIWLLIVAGSNVD